MDLETRLIHRKNFGFEAKVLNDRFNLFELEQLWPVFNRVNVQPDFLDALNFEEIIEMHRAYQLMQKTKTDIRLSCNERYFQIERHLQKERLTESEFYDLIKNMLLFSRDDVYNWSKFSMLQDKDCIKTAERINPYPYVGKETESYSLNNRLSQVSERSKSLFFESLKNDPSHVFVRQLEYGRNQNKESRQKYIASQIIGIYRSLEK